MSSTSNDALIRGRCRRKSQRSNEEDAKPLWHAFRLRRITQRCWLRFEKCLHACLLKVFLPNKPNFNRLYTLAVTPD